MSIKSRAKFVLRHGPQYLRKASEAGLSNPFGLRRLQDILAGFDPLEADVYRQIFGDTDGMLSNYYRETDLFSPNGYFGCVTTIKSVFAAVLEADNIPTPEVFAVFHDGQTTWRKNGRQRAQKHLDETGRIVVKPDIGSQGRSVQVVTSLDPFDAHTGVDVILTEFTQQAEYAHSIFPDALNTIRLFTIRDQQNNPIMASAAHRFGTSKSAPVDNTHSGGLMSNIDLETGVINQAVEIKHGNRVKFHARHPETDQPIQGVVIPHWDGVKDLVHELGRAMPYLGFVGWDIAITKDGPVIIEGNSQASFKSIQTFERLSENKEICQLLANRVPNCQWLQEVSGHGH